MGGVLPSSRTLAKRVSDAVNELLSDPQTPLIEIGPGTGALTRELVRLPNPLVLLERESDFAQELLVRFPKARVICDDFLSIPSFSMGSRGAVVISSLPIRSLPHPELFQARFRELLLSGAVQAVVQFSYGWRDPLDLKDSRVRATRRYFVPFNIPPAFVWVYRLN